MPPSSTYVNNLAAIGARYGSTRNERERDVLKAMQFYAQAAQYGHPGANFELGCLFHFGIPGVVTVNHKKAMKHYKVASEAGMIGAKYNLGLLWETHNEDRAMVLWGEAADLGHIKAMCCLAVRYFHGITIDEYTGKISGVVPQDFNKAMYYWGLAAEQDYPKAIHALSLMYEHGLGVRQHTKRADELRDLAAFCWTQQQQPKPGQIGERPIDLPDWLKKPDGHFPNWKKRNFVSSRRAPPLLLKKYGTGMGPTPSKLLMGDNITAHSYKPSSSSLEVVTTPIKTKSKTQNEKEKGSMNSSFERPRSRSPDCRRSSECRPSSPSKEERSSEFLARIEKIKEDTSNVMVRKPSLFALNCHEKLRSEMPHMKQDTIRSKVVSQTRPPRIRTASPTKTTHSRATTPTASTVSMTTESDPPINRAKSANGYSRTNSPPPSAIALLQSNSSVSSSSSSLVSSPTPTHITKPSSPTTTTSTTKLQPISKSPIRKQELVSSTVFKEDGKGDRKKEGGKKKESTSCSVKKKKSSTKSKNREHTTKKTTLPKV